MIALPFRPDRERTTTTPIPAARPFGLAVWLSVMLAAMSLLFASRASAEERAPAVKHIFVPADKVETWPKGDWVPVPFDEFLTRREADRKRIHGTVAPRIEWQSLTATFDPARGSLTDGRWVAEVRGSAESQRQLMSLAPLDLAVSELRWNDGDVVWGTSPSGEPHLVLESAAKRLEGRWTLASRRLQRSWQFDVRLAASTVSELKLRVPANLSLRSSTGQVKGPLATGEDNWRLWHVHLGSQSRCELLVIESRPAIASESIVLYDQSSSYVLREAEVELQCEINAELFHTPRSSLTLSVADDLTLYSVGFAGDTRLSWRELPRVAGQPRLVEVALPEPQLGRVRTLQVLAGAAAKFDPNWSLPRIAVAGASFTGGRWNVVVETPLTWHNVKPTGLRLAEVDASSATSWRMQFAQYLPDASLTLDVSSPQPRLSIDVLQRLTPTDNQWTLHSEWHWQATSGAAYAARCRVPSGWEILDVESLSNTVGQDIQRWEVVTTPTGERTLVCEFTHGLEDKSTARMRIIATRASSVSDMPQESFECLTPLNCQHAETLISLQLPAGWLWSGHDEAIAAPDGMPRISERWTTFDLWKTQATTWDETTLLIRGLQLDGTLKVPVSLARSNTPASQPASESRDGDSPARVTPADASEGMVRQLVWTRAELQSLIFPGETGFDRHRLSLEAAAPTYVGRLEFDLALPAELVSVRMNGVRAEAQMEGGRFRLPKIPQGGLRSLDIEYRLPSDRDFFRNRQTLPVPQVAGTVLGFRWLFALPPDARLGEQPSGLRLRQPLDPTPWLRRLFGPLGRDANREWFNPFQARSWSQVWQPKPAREEPTFPLDSFAPPGWQVREAIGPGLPRDIRWLTFSAVQVRSLAWLLMLLCGGIGCWLRARRSAPRVHIAAIWLGLCLVGVVLSDPITAEVLGGCLIGALMAVLLPRRLIMSYSGHQNAAARGAFDETIAYQRVGGASLLVLSIAWSAVIAQDVPAIPGTRFEVLIPISDPANALKESVRPAGDPPLVHVSKSLWEHWHTQPAANRPIPAALLSSAEYRVDFDGDQARLQVDYFVHRLWPERAVTLPFPFVSVPLGGAEACLVDGQPRPVSLNESRDALLLELPPLPQARPDTGLSKIVTQRISFTLLPRVAASGSVIRLNLALPPVVNSQVTVTSSTPGLAEVALRRGELISDTANSTTTAQLGASKQLRVDWSPAGTERVRSVADAAADVYCMAELTPTGLRQRYRTHLDITAGEVTAVSWLIPAGALIRDSDILVDDLLQWSLEPHASGRQKLTLEYSRPRTGVVTLDVSAWRPLSTSADALRWIPWQLVDNAEAGLRVKPHLFALGVATPTGFKVTLSTPTSDSAPLAENVFLRGWSGITLPRPPQLLMQLPTQTELAFQLTPLTAQRKVRQELLLNIGKDSIDWTLYAEVTNGGAPAFHHEVLFAAPFRPDDISVMEDEAERLLSWSAADSRAILFLRGETTGIQNVSVQGREAIPTDRKLRIPTRWLADADTTDFSVRVSHDPTWQLHVLDERNQELSPIEIGTPQPGRTDLLLGRFRADANASALQINLIPHEPAGAAEAWTMVGPAGADSWAMRHVERFSDEGLITARLFWPTGWITNGSVKLAPSLKELARRTLPDGIELTVQSTTRAAEPTTPTTSESRDVVFEVTRPLKDLVNVVVTPPTTLDVDSREHHWLLSDDLASWLHRRADTIKTDLEKLPVWIKPLLPSSGAQWLQLTDEMAELEFVRPDQSVTQPTPKLLWMDTAIWLTEGTISQGRTWLLVQPHSLASLSMRRPDGIRWQAVFVDHVLRELDDDTASADALPIDDIPDQPWVLLTFFWQVDEQHRKQIVARRDTALPMPTDSSLRPERHDLTLVSTGFRDLSSTRGARRVPDWDVRLSRASQVTRALHLDSARTSPLFARLQRQVDDDLATAQTEIDRLPFDVGGGRTARERLQAVIAEHRSLADTEATVTPRGTPSVSAEETLAESRTNSWSSHSWLDIPTSWSAIAETNSNASLSIILVDRRWVLWIVATVAFVAVIPLFRMWLRWQTGEWLARYPYLAWTSLALVWWTCLTPSVLGFAVLLIAAASAIRGRRAARVS